jgi:hypothetical protein
MYVRVYVLVRKCESNESSILPNKYRRANGVYRTIGA